MKSSENDFISLPVFYLIMYLMKAPKHFENNIHFENLRAEMSKLSLRNYSGNDAFRHEIKIFLTNVMSLLLFQIVFRRTMHLKMTIWTLVGKKWPFMYESDIFIFFEKKK